MAFFENLKNKLVDYFKNKKDPGEKLPIKKNIENNQNANDAEESSVLIDETDKERRIRFSNDEEEKTKVNIILISGRKLPLMYFMFGLLTVAFMIGILIIQEFKNYAPKNIYTEIGPVNVKFLNFFNLPLINNFVFHLMNSCTALLGFSIVYCLFLILNLKFSRKGYSKLEFAKLYVTISYGLFSNLIHLIYGFIPFMEGMDSINSLLIKEVHITIYEFCFFLQIFFSILFGIFTTILIYSLQKKPSYSIDNLEVITDVNKNKWFNYKLLTNIYLLFFIVAFFIITLHNNNVILKEFTSPVIKSNYSYLLAFIPYVLYFLNIILYSLFYHELRNCDTILSQTASNKDDFEKIQKNIL